MTVDIRLALPTDLASVQGIEDAADQVFATVMDISTWGNAPTGEERAAEPGFLFVAALTAEGDGHDEDDEVVGFAHLLDLEGRAHLEQIAVLPDRARRGIGAALLEAVCRYAAEQGFGEVTLRTFRDVAWNAPFYARHGFEVLEPEPAWMAPLYVAEERSGLTRQGARVAMGRTLT